MFPEALTTNQPSATPRRPHLTLLPLRTPPHHSPNIHVLKNTSKIQESRHDVSLSAARGGGCLVVVGGVVGGCTCCIGCTQTVDAEACRIATSGSRPRLYRDCSSVYSRNCQSDLHPPQVAINSMPFTKGEKKKRTPMKKKPPVFRLRYISPSVYSVKQKMLLRYVLEREMKRRVWSQCQG